MPHDAPPFAGYFQPVRLSPRTKLGPGAHLDENGTTFVAWTTTASRVEVRLFDERCVPLRTEALEARGDGRFERHLDAAFAGTLYKLVLDGEEMPDPYARFLPFGVHGPARVLAKGRAEPLAEPPPPSQWTIYELHVGTASPEGTYRGAEAHLDGIADIGFTAIELMPVAAFAGARGWGYDGVALYAPYAPYGTPEELRAFVRAAHRRGLAVVLDVVYNHFGPAGNYLSRYAPEYFTSAVETPWGQAPDFAREPMRRLVLDNVRYWLEEFGIDALRLDATHAIHDTSNLHVLQEITDIAHSFEPPRRVFFEDERNEPAVVAKLGADGVWADDFHHQLHVLLTRERDGYYAAYEGTVAALASTINDGWTFTGQPFSPWNGKPRGKSARAAEIAPENLVYCIQNHDQIGNRAFGTRLSVEADLDAYCAASALLLFLPATPLVFMGQEWAASTRFLFFSDHEGDLGEAIRRGRREEFESFAAFTDPVARQSIPDPQAVSSFDGSKLRWDERTREPHLHVLGTYRAMLQLRRNDAVLSASCSWEELRATAHGQLLEVVRTKGRSTRRLFVNFSEQEIDLGSLAGVASVDGNRVLFTRGRYEDGRLGARSVVIVASGDAR